MPEEKYNPKPISLINETVKRQVDTKSQLCNE